MLNILHYLIISRPKGDYEAAASIEYECANSKEAEAKLQELTKSHPLQMFKIETWTKIR